MSLVIRCASEIEPRAVQWIWHSRLAVGKHTCIGGEPGTGKSQLSIFAAATVSMGGRWPCDEEKAPRGGVIILSAEDGERDTIVPRLHAAGADLGSIHLVSAVKEENAPRRAFNLQADMALLEERIQGIGDIKLVIIDPISSYLGSADSHKNAEIRGVLEPLSEMAERLNVAVLSITHFSKAGATNATKALHRFIGSIAFVGAPRMAFAVMEDPDNEGRRLFLHAKNNLAVPPQGLAYKLNQVVIEPAAAGIIASRVDFELEAVDMTANEALAVEVGKGKTKAIDAAKNFLTELLADGPELQPSVETTAAVAGLSWATVRRAKNELGVESHRVGDGWSWSMPGQDAQGAQGTPSKPLEMREDAQGAQFHKVSTLSTLNDAPDPWAELDIPPEFDRRQRQ